ncbi:IS3 family transposase [Bifidobacterium longum]|uniref:IS3 family transposase n=1 Tax=Bifidobacterium longum TaxID=216816 RepID=UPI00267264B5|nr:IS3 family transposase [Bifidobacterium longum]
MRGPLLPKRTRPHDQITNTTQTGSGRYRTPCGKPAAYTAEKHRSQSGRQLAKTQLIHRNVYTNVEQLRSDVNRYVWWYNHQRLHSTLGYLSPVEFTQQGKTL